MLASMGTAGSHAALLQAPKAPLAPNKEETPPPFAPKATVSSPRCSPRMAWSDSEWEWDSAARLRSMLSTQAQRQQFMEALMNGDADWEDSKVVLALKCQRVAKRGNANAYGLDTEEQQVWRELMDDLAACRYEGYRGDLHLADAIGERLGLIESKRLASV